MGSSLRKFQQWRTFSFSFFGLLLAFGIHGLIVYSYPGIVQSRIFLGQRILIRKFVRTLHNFVYQLLDPVHLLTGLDSSFNRIHHRIKIIKQTYDFSSFLQARDSIGVKV